MASFDHSWLCKMAQLGKDSRFELKAVEIPGEKLNRPRRDALADELAAFGNAGGGQLVLGVTYKRRPPSLTPEQLDVLVRTVREICLDCIDPPLPFNLFRIPVPAPETGGISVVEIPEGVTIHRSPSGYFRRHGAAKLPMDSNAIRRLSRARGPSGSTSTDTQVIRDTGINSLQPDLWRRCPSSRTTDSANAALTKLHFAKFDANGGMKASPSSRIKLLRFAASVPAFNWSAVEN